MQRMSQATILGTSLKKTLLFLPLMPGSSERNHQVPEHRPEGQQHPGGQRVSRLGPDRHGRPQRSPHTGTEYCQHPASPRLHERRTPWPVLPAGRHQATLVIAVHRGDSIFSCLVHSLQGLLFHSRRDKRQGKTNAHRKTTPVIAVCPGVEVILNGCLLVHSFHSFYSGGQGKNKMINFYMR